MTPSPATRFVLTSAEKISALVLIIGVLLYANLTRMPVGPKAFLLERITIVNVFYAMVFLGAWTICFSNLEEYRSGRFARFKQCVDILKGTSCITAVLAAILLFSKVHTPLHTVLPWFWLLSTALVFLRFFGYWILEILPFQEKRRVLILGTGPMARRAWRELRTSHYRTVQISGFVDTGSFQAALPEITANYLGDVDNLETLLLRHVVDVIVIAIPAKSCYAAIQRAITIAEEVGVELIQFDHVFQLKKQDAHPFRSRLNSEQLQSHSRLFSQFVKRAFDVVSASVSLILLFPVLLAIAVSVKLTSPGPALFIQERYGHRRRKFKLLKFRTMVANAEHLMKDLEARNEAIGPIFKMRNDPRVTPLGRFLRKTSLDELPQLWNVLVGNMSLVGPRPMSLRDVALFSNSYLMRRFHVKPGITGLWQINGRSNTTFDHWISMDFHYIDQWSLLLDLKILLRTIPAVLRGSGAM